MSRSILGHGSSRAVTAVALVALLGSLAACGSANDQTNAGSAPQGGDGGTSAAAPAGNKDLTIAYIDWDEDIAVTHLFKKVLEDKGYTVTMQHVADAGPVYVGLDRGQVDLFLDAWLPQTHKQYWDRYGANLEDLTHWYDNAKLTIAVPNYMNVNSIADLPSVASQVNGRIVGIEPGAGLTAATKKALTDYNLSGYQLQASSTPAMLAALKKATDAKQPIVVTLWRPHWAYAAYPIKDLQDPKGVMGSAEQIHAIGKKGFANDFPEVDAMMKKFTMDDNKLASLEQAVLQTNKDNPDKGVTEWLNANPDFVPSLG